MKILEDNERIENENELIEELKATLKKRMEKVDREYKIKAAKSRREAAKIILTDASCVPLNE
jgi:predicted PP-loop superfamily ATPase